MEELVLIKEKEVVCNSLQVCKLFGKNHQHVLEKIDKLAVENSTTKKFFHFSQYKAGDNQFHRICHMNRDGFSLLAMGFTGKKALEWKLKYIEAFNRMEKLLSQQHTQQWQQTRQASKQSRKLEAEEIKELVKYAKAQGSGSAEKYYMVLSKLANNTVGISGNKRETASIHQLNTLILVENIINHMIQEGIQQQLPYKKIYQECKARLEQFQEIAYLKGAEL